MSPKVKKKCSGHAENLIILVRLVKISQKIEKNPAVSRKLPDSQKCRPRLQKSG